MKGDKRSTRMTRTISGIAGSVGSFPAILLAIALVVAWILIGVVLFQGDERLEVLNLLTMVGTVTTFIMVFIIQNTQNREDRAVQTKLDAQGHALRQIMEHLGIDFELPLSELAGLEEAPEPDIKEEQRNVRSKDAANGRREVS